MRGIALSLLCAAACAPAAHADIIHFMNPAPGEAGHYDWQSAVPGSANTWLDLTLSPAHQTGIANGNSVGQVLYEGEGSGEVVHDGGARVLNRALQGMFAATEGLIFGEPVAPAQSPSRFWNTFGYMFEVDGGRRHRLCSAGRAKIHRRVDGGRQPWLARSRAERHQLRAIRGHMSPSPAFRFPPARFLRPGAGGLLLGAATLRFCRRRRAAAGSAVAA